MVKDQAINKAHYLGEKLIIIGSLKLRNAI